MEVHVRRQVDPDGGRRQGAEPSEAEAALLLSAAPRFGAVRVRKAVDAFGSARAALAAPRGDVREATGRDLVILPELRARVRAWLAASDGIGIDVVAYADPGFPPALQTLHDPPPALFVRGRLPRALMGPWDGLKALAIVGTRDPTSRARRFAADLGQELAQSGIVVVSGLAIGIDGAAHEGALEATDGAPPVAVLAGGLDEVRPARHAGLAARIVAAGGALVSEDPPGAPAYGHRFVARNRIVSGLSRGVLVVEAGARSGALHTADFALDQGRAVFAVPDHPTATRALGNLQLLASGAKMVLRASDVTDELGWASMRRTDFPPVRYLGLLLAIADRAPCRAEAVPGDPVENLIRIAELEIEGFVVRDGTGRIRPSLEGRAAVERAGQRSPLGSSA